MRHETTRQLALLTLLAMLPFAVPAADSGFLNDYSKLPAPVSGEGGGTDRIYIAPGATERIAKYDAVMVDQPEVFLSPNSPYKGAKPDDLKAIAGAVRAEIIKTLQDGGYKIADAPGANVLYVRPAITDLALEKKGRRLLAYTPIGFVLNAGVKALQDLMQKYDVVGMNFEAELSDSTTNEILASGVMKRGAVKDKAAGVKEQRLTFDEVNKTIESYSSRLRCRLDNSKLAADKQINCLDPKARATAAKPKA